MNNPMSLPMKSSVLRYAVLAFAVALTLSLGACKPGEQADVDKADPATASAEDADTLKTPGLSGEKEQASYMVGMDIAQSLKPIKDDIDVAIVTKAINDTLVGDKPLLNETQANQIREAFAAKLQARRVAELQAQAKKNQAEGEAFLAANAGKPGITTTESGLQYEVLVKGDGPTPKPTDAVLVNYKGMLLDGTVFDSSYERNEPAVLSLEHVIPGWREGVALMPVGSKYRMWIPGDLAYGATGTPGGPIEPNTTLVFEVELLEIGPPPAE